MSYEFLLPERARERVNTYGHIKLTRSEAARISTTKQLCVVCTVACTTGMVWNKTLTGALLTGNFATLVFKLAELVETRKTMSSAQIAVFIAVSVAITFVAAGSFIVVVFMSASRAQF